MTDGQLLQARRPPMGSQDPQSRMPPACQDFRDQSRRGGLSRRGRDRDAPWPFVSRALAERKTLGALIGQYVQEVSPLHRNAESEIARLKAMARRKHAEMTMANLRPIDIARYRDARLKVDGVLLATWCAS